MSKALCPQRYSHDGTTTFGAFFMPYRSSAQRETLGRAWSNKRLKQTALGRSGIRAPRVTGAAGAQRRLMNRKLGTVVVVVLIAIGTHALAEPSDGKTEVAAELFRVMGLERTMMA